MPELLIPAMTPVLEFVRVVIEPLFEIAVVDPMIVPELVILWIEDPEGTLIAEPPDEMTPVFKRLPIVSPFSPREIPPLIPMIVPELTKFVMDEGVVAQPTFRDVG